MDKIKTYMGIDIGSISTKGVIIDSDNKIHNLEEKLHQERLDSIKEINK